MRSLNLKLGWKKITISNCDLSVQCCMEPFPNYRRTFYQHGSIGWYISPAMEHYRLYCLYFPRHALDAFPRQ